MSSKRQPSTPSAYQPRQPVAVPSLSPTCRLLRDYHPKIRPGGSAPLASSGFHALCLQPHKPMPHSSTPPPALHHAPSALKFQIRPNLYRASRAGWRKGWHCCSCFPPFRAFSGTESRCLLKSNSLRGLAWIASIAVAGLLPLWATRHQERRCQSPARVQHTTI